jgi:four helix bundle protein
MSEQKQPIHSYRDLVVWQKAMSLAEAAYRLTAGFPREEALALTTQLRRSGASVAANIAEGYGRDSKGAYVQHLRIAQGSLKEFETHLMLAGRVILGNEKAVAALLDQCDRIGKMLRALIRAIEQSGKR